MGLMPGRLTAVANGLWSKRAKPTARTDDLVIEELGDELLVYDQGRARAHSLNSTATRVWRACDGQTSIDALGRDLQLDPQALRRALEELRDCELLDDGPQRPVTAGMTRRDMTIRTARLGVAAASVPLIYSVAVPATAAATPTLAQCFQYTDKDCDGCTKICGCCCCCAAGDCKTCAPVNLCSTVQCTGGGGAQGNCTTIAPNPPNCVPADTIPLPPCKPPNAAQVTRPCCTP